MSEESLGLGGETGGVGEVGGNVPPQDNSTSQVDTEIENLIPEWAKDFKVDKDLLIDPSLKAIKDVDSLVKSYVHAQRQLGKKGVIIPSENSTKEEWDTFYQKVGVPLEGDKYAEKVKIGEDKAFDDDFTKNFIKKAHELRVSPKQAEELYNHFSNETKTISQRGQAEYLENSKKQLEVLRDTMGEDAYNVGLAKANRFIAENIGKDFLDHMVKSGIAADAKVVDAFIKIAKNAYSEEKIPGAHSNSALTKDEMEREINRVMGDFSDPYHNPNHPDHKRRVDEVQKYFAKLI